MQASKKHILLRHNQNIPRYTSYPPANFFTSISDSNYSLDLWDCLSPHQAVSLYVHIPFCPKMCWFCGCHTQATARHAPVTNYLQLLYEEIRLVVQKMPKGISVGHIHFGGGSPTILTSDDFTQLMDHLRGQFSFAPACQIAIEIDPRKITPDKVRAYRQSGVDRISLGVQDIDDKVMAAINRVQPFDVTRRAVDLCRGQGIDHINIDLVYGLPHQTISSVAKTAAAVCDLSPERLALFGYAHVPWMKKHMRLIADQDLPDPALRYDLFNTVSNALEIRGYVPIGIDHFAKPEDSLVLSQRSGLLKRNFQGYVPKSEDMPIIGLGVSSISQTPDGYVQNTIHMPHYRDSIQEQKLPVSRFHIFSADDRLRGEIIERLMCDCTVDLKTIMARHQNATVDMLQIRHDLSGLINDGLVDMTPDAYITVHDRLAVRMAASVFDAYRQKVIESITPRRHAAAI